MIDFINKLVGACSDAELELLANVALKERERRLEAKVRAIGKFPELSESEIALCKSGTPTDRVSAIKEYRTRNGCTLLEAKIAVEKYLDANK